MVYGLVSIATKAPLHHAGNTHPATAPSECMRISLGASMLWLQYRGHSPIGSLLHLKKLALLHSEPLLCMFLQVGCCGWNGNKAMKTKIFSHDPCSDSQRCDDAAMSACRGWRKNWNEALFASMPKRRREPLLGQLVDVEMGYVGDEEAIPAVSAAAPWPSGQTYTHLTGPYMASKSHLPVCNTRTGLPSSALTASNNHVHV